MQKHDKMVALAKEKSAEMTETAITAIETMYRKNIKISVAELIKLTGLSRGFFYNNPNVKQVMMELKEKQQGMILRNPKSDAIAKAQEARIKSLEQKLSDSVPKNEYESLQKKYEELQVKYSQMKKGTLLKMYDQLYEEKENILCRTKFMMRKMDLLICYLVIIICQNWHLQISNQLMGNMGCFVKAIYRNTERQNIKYCCYKENLSSI